MFIPPLRRTTAAPQGGRAPVRVGRVIGAGFVLAASLALLPQTAAFAADGSAPKSDTVSAAQPTPVPSTPPGSRAPQPAPPTITPTAPPKDSGPSAAPATVRPPGSADKTVEPPRTPGAGPITPPPGDRLADTGGNSSTPLLIGGGAALVALGGGTIVLLRRRGSATA